MLMYMAPWLQQCGALVRGYSGPKLRRLVLVLRVTQERGFRVVTMPSWPPQARSLVWAPWVQPDASLLLLLPLQSAQHVQCLPFPAFPSLASTRQSIHSRPFTSMSGLGLLAASSSEA